jgi:hypothetical protein
MPTMAMRLTNPEVVAATNQARQVSVATTRPQGEAPMTMISSIASVLPQKS